MNTYNKSFIIVAIANVVVACLSQVLGSNLDEKFDTIAFQLLVFPLVIVLLNIVLGFKFRMGFYQYSLFVYLGLCVSLFVWGGMILVSSTFKELPPGEVVLGADIIFVIVVAMVQTIIFLLLNLIIFAVYKFFLRRGC